MKLVVAYVMLCLLGLCRGPSSYLTCSFWDGYAGMATFISSEGGMSNVGGSGGVRGLCMLCDSDDTGHAMLYDSLAPVTLMCHTHTPPLTCCLLPAACSICTHSHVACLLAASISSRHHCHRQLFFFWVVIHLLRVLFWLQKVAHFLESHL